jgi:transcriptional regulator with XRE-family HTH domain
MLYCILLNGSKPYSEPPGHIYRNRELLPQTKPDYPDDTHGYLSAMLWLQELADKIHIHVTHLSKMENGHLLPSIDIVQRLMKVFAVSADNLLNDSEDSVVEMQNHELNEQLMLINQLDEDEKNALIKIINSMLTKKRMKDLLDGKVNF